jgi:hypothetical protein
MKVSIRRISANCRSGTTPRKATRGRTRARGIPAKRKQARLRASIRQRRSVRLSRLRPQVRTCHRGRCSRCGWRSRSPLIEPALIELARIEPAVIEPATTEPAMTEPAREALFAGVVDEPVVMDGKIAVPRGATVTGRIEAAPASSGGRGRGYLRLTLDTITIAGKTTPLRTSGLFVRGSAGEVLSSGRERRGTGPADRDPLAERSPSHLPPGRDRPAGPARDSIQQPESPIRYGIAAETSQKQALRRVFHRHIFVW